MEDLTKINSSNKSKQNIVHVLDVFPSKSETFVINFILETLKQNCTAQIISNGVAKIQSSSQKELLEKSGLYTNAETFNPILPENKIKRIALATSILFKNFKYGSVFFKTLNSKKYGLKAKTLKMWFQAAIFLKYRKADVFHAHFGVSGKLVAEMKAIGAINSKMITSFYGYDTFSSNETQNYFKAYYLDTFKNSSHIITSSNYLFNNLKKLNVPQQKVLVNAVGVDLEIFNYKKRNYNSVFKIITVGRLIPLKGQHLGIEVINLLKQRGHNVHYTIIGNGEALDALQQHIKELKLEDSVMLSPGGTQTDIIDALQQQHLFLMTSITDTTGRAEGQGLVIAEAKAAGLPVVGFNSGGIPDTILNNKTGFIIKEGDVKAMADAVEKFIVKPDLINEMGLKARSFVEKNFNNTIQSKNIIDLYND